MKKSKDNEVEEGPSPMEVITYLLEKEKNASDLEGTELLRLSQRSDIPQWFESVVNNEIITRVRGY